MFPNLIFRYGPSQYTPGVYSLTTIYRCTVPRYHPVIIGAIGIVFLGAWRGISSFWKNEAWNRSLVIKKELGVEKNLNFRGT